MKKNLLLFSAFACFVFTVKSQITITQSDMPVIGSAYISANDSNGISPGGSGASQNWNFTTLTNNQGSDTAAMYAPSSLTGSSAFPTATIGAINGPEDYGFYKISSTELEVLGMYTDITKSGTPSNLIFNPTMTMLTFPSTLNTSYSDTWGFTLVMFYGQSGIDSIKVVFAGDYPSIIDGSGTISTPAISNMNAIRQKVTEMTTTTSYMKGTTTGGQWVPAGSPSTSTAYSYRWWGNSTKVPIAEVSTDSAGVPKDAGYYIATINAPALGINTIPEKSLVSVFPNPSSSSLTVTGINITSYIVVLDMEGRLMESTLIKKDNTNLNVSTYQNGIYFYQVVDLKGNILGKGKFAVAR